MKKQHQLRCLILELILLACGARAFVMPNSPHVTTQEKRHGTSSSQCFSGATITESQDRVVQHVVLFGVGDLRADDHEGLQAAIESQTTGPVLPLFVLTPDMVSNTPGAVTHTYDTANQIAAAIQEVDQCLQDSVHLKLHTVLVEEKNNKPLGEVVREYVGGAGQLHVHVCDLGPADNAMRYGPYSHLLNTDDEDFKIRLQPWRNNLRDEPWDNVKDLPEFFPQYENRYREAPKIPLSTTIPASGEQTESTIQAKSIPTAEEMQQYFLRSISSSEYVLDEERCRNEQNTGLYATHWGGLSANSVGCRSVLHLLQTYTVDCNEDSKRFRDHVDCTLRKTQSNPKSLEHASMLWQLRSEARNTDNWLAGEAMTRYLAAPLVLGTIGPRRIWYSARADHGGFFTSPLRRLVEGREWHNLLAARNMAVDEAYQPRTDAGTQYKYWRYHGFLCRYAETKFESNSSSSSSSSSSNSNEGILLLHGFGASGSQWNKAMQELGACSNHYKQGLAPDQLGFGQAEKPAISYTSYLWTSQMMDFVKEVALNRNGWKTFVTGGNSIGGFVSMSLAACDNACPMTLSSSGAPGLERCTGLVLMNSAGPVMSQQESELETSLEKRLSSCSVAEMTALQELPPCKPPVRPVARAFGNVLLGYLRPRIQSICVNLYPTRPAAVDDLLCKGIERDSLDPGAINVMMAGAKLPPPRTANELLAAKFGASRDPATQLKESTFKGPVLIAQGVLDPLNDAKDRMNRYQALREGIEVAPVEAGHCPHDELPEQIARNIAAWTATRSCAPASAKVPPNTAVAA
jgi:pimeloyl-ACP methyl ester carboxylesterase